MLELIRQRAQGLVVGIIIGLICITFALWGVQEYFNAGGDPTVVKVNGEKIPASDFYRYYAQLERGAEIAGGEVDRAQFERADFRRAQLEEFARNQLLESVAREAGVVIADEAVVANIRQTPIFQQDGKFTAESYSRALSVLGYGSQEYEERLRGALAISQFQFGVGGSALVAEGELRKLLAVKAETRDLGYAVLRRQDFEETLTPTDEDLQSYFEAHRGDYVKPERVDVSYLVLDVNILKNQVDVAEDAVTAYYEANLESFTDEEERNVNHILIQVAQDASEEAVAAAREKVADLAARAQAGESFEDLAGQYSDDIASQAEGGETGLFPRGVMDPKFEEAAYAMSAVGDVSEPIRTKFGWHVLKLKEIKPASVKPLDEVRDQVVNTLKGQEAETLFFEMAERIDAPVFENPETLEVAADELGLRINRTGLKSRSELANLFSDRVVEAIFSEDVHDARINSLPLDDGDNRVVVVRVAEIEAERPRELAEVTEDVRSAWLRDAATAKAAELGRSLVQKLKDGADPETALPAANEKLKWKRVDGADRRSPEVTRVVLREAFRLRPAEDGVRYAGLELASGDYALIAVYGAQRPEADSIPGIEVDGLKRDINGLRGNASWSLLTDEFEQNRPLEIFPDKL